MHAKDFCYVTCYVAFCLLGYLHFFFVGKFLLFFVEACFAFEQEKINMLLLALMGCMAFNFQLYPLYSCYGNF